MHIIITLKLLLTFTQNNHPVSLPTTHELFLNDVWFYCETFQREIIYFKDVIKMLY